jgi:hypothetical protein
MNIWKPIPLTFVLLISFASQAQPGNRADVSHALKERIEKDKAECSSNLVEDGNVVAYDLYGAADENGNLTFRLGKQKVVISTYGKASEIRRVLRVLRFHNESRLTDKLRTVRCAAFRIVNRRISTSMDAPFTDDQLLDYTELLFRAAQGVSPSQAGPCLSNVVYAIPPFANIASNSTSYLFLSVMLSALPMDAAMALYPGIYWRLVQQWYHLKHSRNLASRYDDQIAADITNNATTFPDLAPYTR